MNWPRLIRGLKIAWSVVCGIACVLLIVLWVRSHSRRESIYFDPAQSMTVVGVISLRGDVLLTKYEDPFSDGDGWGMASDSLDSVEPESAEYSRKWIFELQKVPGRTNLIVPYWCAVLLTAAIAVASWIRFSLRTLLIATTLVAVVLGLMVWAIR